MPKYHITITRTYTYEGNIEAEDGQEASAFTEGLESTLDNHDFELETTWEVEPEQDLTIEDMAEIHEAETGTEALYRELQQAKDESFMERYNIARLRGEGGTR
jgi:hypothetical protein